MRNVLVLAALLATASPINASTIAVAQPPSTPAQQMDSTRETIRLGYGHVRDNDLAAAAAAFDSAIISKGFAGLSEDLRYRTLLLAGQIADEQGRHEQAHGLLVRASEFPVADSSAWHGRLSPAFSLQDYQDSAHAVATIARRWPDTLASINDRAIYVIEHELGEDGTQTDARLELLRSLFAAHWRDAEGEPSSLWFNLTQLLLANDDVDQASVVAARIDSARVALAMRVDKRFDRITQADPEAFDVGRFAAAQVAAARAKMEAAPDHLGPRMLLQRFLLDTLELDQVLTMADEVIAKVKDGKGSSIYEDFDEYYIWILDQRAEALARLGRWDEAIQQWAVAARRPEDGGMNVSQILNLGLLYADLERPVDAMNMVSELGTMSPYGRMQLEMVRFQAALQLENTADIATHLAFMREHRADAIATWQEALLLNGDLDAATELLIERLDSETWRADALVDMQQYAEVRMTPVEAERQARWHAILARPEVKQALERVGRIERFELAPART